METTIKSTSGKIAALAIAASVAIPMAANADQYWVGGTSGLWGGDNWATEAGGTGGAWTSGNTGWFTTSPSTIDLAGSSQSATRFKTTGFSAANRCVANITNSSETASTLTFSGLNRGSDNDLAFTDLIIRNVAVSDSSTWGFELTSGSHVYFGSGSSYTKPTANSNGNLYVGMFSATSNSLTVASGATVNVNNGVYVGCSSAATYVCATGVVHVVGGTLNVPGKLIMGTSTNNDGTGSKGHGVVVVENGGVLNVTGDVVFGCKWKSGQTSYGQQSAEIHVNEGGTLNVGGKFGAGEYGKKTVVVDGGLLKVSGNFEPEYANGTDRYKARNYNVTVKNGGILAIKGFFAVNSYKDGKETVVFDGGTYRADGNANTQSSYINNSDYNTDGKNADILVGTGGMTIDSQSNTITWNTRIDESEGKVTKKGSGKLVLKWTTYNSGGMDVDEGTLSFGGTTTQIMYGDLTIKGGATLEKQTGNNPSYLAQSVVFKDGAKLSVPYSGGAIGAVVANAITVEGSLDVSFSAVPAEGAYPLLTITGEGTFDEGVLSRINKPEGDAYAGALFALSADEKSVMLILSSDPVWIGGKSGNLGDPTKWSTGVVPGAGTNAIITAAVAATLTNSAAFKATSITFPAGCPKVTIEGAPLMDIEAINNLSSANHEFKVPVSGEAIVISNTTTYCVFTGGLTMDSVTFGVAGNTKASIYGSWHIKGDWHPVTGNALYNGASVTVDGALLNPNEMSINSGCVVTAATLQATGTCSYFTYNNWGRLVVTGLCSVTTTVDPYFTRNDASDDATVEFGAYYANSPGKWTYANAKNIIVGDGGMDAATDIEFENARTLYSRTSGFALNSSGGQYLTHQDGLTIDTTQYETELPATITINGVVRHQSSIRPGKFTVAGCGKVLFNSVSTFTGGLTRRDTATVAVNAGKKAGNGLVTVNAGATFEVAQSGTVALGGGLTLADGAILGFNFTERRTEPVLDATGKTVTLGENGTVVVKVSSADELRPKGGANVLTAGGTFTGANVSLAAGAPSWVRGVSVNADGNIVLAVKPKGLMVFVK